MKKLKGVISSVGVIFSFFVFQTLLYASASEATFERTERLFLHGDYSKVISQADSLIEARSDRQDELYYLKALSELKLNKLKEARQDFERVITKYPGSKVFFDAYVGVGDSYLLEKNITKAIDIYNEITDRFAGNRNMPMVYYRLADCYVEMGIDDKAKYYLDKANSMAPLSFEARMKRAAGKATTAGISPTGEIETFFSVQVGSFKVRKNAENLATKLSRRGFESYVELPAGSSEKLYRVKVGRLATRKEAEYLAGKLKGLGYKTHICVKNTCD